MDGDTEKLLKNALQTGNFAHAQALVPAYREEVISRLSAANTNEAREQIMQSFHSLLSLARVTRAHLAAQLSAVKREGCYRSPNLAQHTWQFEG